ncbi:CBO0543 family protein [Neobacillus sp. DY30]|uniref:CBO0543 family protein n=1 Tax=Neobacillus sp. DY30 TaxID=3047871 RepID=UPI0024BF1EF4|nr:CBO0543 family protein [Neobacillus sp. DY30]WHX98571.1 CBO0543 family protein [Neobacillus sp. DY30]
MVAIVLSISWIIAAMKFGDRDWSKYYPSMLFAALGNALYEILCYKYQLWSMEPNGVVYSIIPMLLLILVGMPLSTWVFLSKYPSELSLYKKVIYVSFFVIVFIGLEYLSVKLGAISYHNGWNLGWSLFFVIVMFMVIRLHFTKPLLALFISIPFSLLLCMIFEVTLDKMK